MDTQCPSPPEALSAWISLFTELDVRGVPSSERLATIADPEVRFRDPFNDVCAIESLRRLLAHSRRQLPGARFEVLDTAWSAPTA